jgi:simple sugar transport system permease protein
MGCFIQYFELPPFLVTLAGMFLARGVGFMVHPQSLGIQHTFFSTPSASIFRVALNEKISLPFTATSYAGVVLVGSVRRALHQVRTLC